MLDNEHLNDEMEGLSTPNLRKGIRITFSRSRKFRKGNRFDTETAKSSPTKPLGVLNATPRRVNENRETDENFETDENGVNRIYVNQISDFSTQILDKPKLWKSLPAAKFEKSILPQISRKNSDRKNQPAYKFKNVERSAVSIPSSTTSFPNKIETQILAPLKTQENSFFRRNSQVSPSTVQDITQQVNPQYDYSAFKKFGPAPKFDHF